MTARDELFQLMLGRTTTKAVERIIAAGYSKPRTVTTAEELGALPAGVVVMDHAGYVLKRSTRTVWLSTDEEGATYVVLPATVLWEPQP